MAKDQDGDVPSLGTLKYLVSSVLGAHDNSTVALVTDKQVGGGRYALRILKREDEKDDLSIERARAEAAASGKLNHPSVLKVHDFRLRKSFFRVSRSESLMEYVEGKTLDTWEQFPIGPAVLAFQQAAAALAHMHRRGVFHGTLEPSRCLLSRSGHVKLRGYGLSEIPLATRLQIKPDPAFTSPEQLKEKVLDARTEIYALGATIYRLVTGQPPTGGALLGGRSEGKKIPTPSALNPKIPVPLNNLLVNCLQSNPNRRPAEMYDVVKQVEELVKGLHVKENALAGLSAQSE